MARIKSEESGRFYKSTIFLPDNKRRKAWKIFNLSCSNSKTIFVESLNFVFKIYENFQKHQAIRKRETILAIMKMLENVDLTDPKTLVNFALKFSHYNPSFTLY